MATDIVVRINGNVMRHATDMKMGRAHEWTW